MEKKKLSVKKSFSLADPQNSHLHIRNMLICISAIFSFAYPQLCKFLFVHPANNQIPLLNPCLIAPTILIETIFFY